MTRYRKRPVEVEAWQVGGGEIPPTWIDDAMVSGTMKADYDNFGFKIKTLEGDVRARYGDYIIQGVKGELYPCKPDIFEQTYEVVE